MIWKPLLTHTNKEIIVYKFLMIFKVLLNNPFKVFSNRLPVCLFGRNCCQILHWRYLKFPIYIFDYVQEIVSILNLYIPKINNSISIIGKKIEA